MSAVKNKNKAFIHIHLITITMQLQYVLLSFQIKLLKILNDKYKLKKYFDNIILITNSTIISNIQLFCVNIIIQK